MYLSNYYKLSVFCHFVRYCDIHEIIYDRNMMFTVCTIVRGVTIGGADLRGSKMSLCPI